MHYYFAYGSNMNQEQMTERCPSATLVGVAELQDYRLAFSIFSPKRLCGCADIIPSSGESVYGLLYQLPEVDMAALDTFEGAPVHYRRTTVQVRSRNEMVEAQSYEVVSKQSDVHPSAHYLGLIQNAAARNAFPKKYKDFLRSIGTLRSI